MVHPPGGTVTFLVTDIEGSTRRWERFPEQMGAAVARHDMLVRQAIEQFGGFVFKTVGDAFCAAFATAPDALLAAIAAQRALNQEPWGEVGSLRVRMALHTGTAEERDRDYFGQPLNRTARLLAAGHGGQTLLSLAAEELIRDELPPDATLVDMGAHRLKDLHRPEHVFQVLVAGLPSEFPPLRTLNTRPNNLPAQATPLIGRERELAAAHQQLLSPDVRLLTFTGPGGSGKTRISLQVAAEAIDNFAQGVYFVQLAPIGDVDLVCSTIAATLGVHESGEQPLLESLHEALRERSMLLLLDNF